MKRIYITLIALFFIQFDSLAHPVHVSVTNITFSDDTMYVMINTFVDDWETAFFHYNSNFISLKTDTIFKNPWFSSYFRRSFKIEINHKSIELPAEPDTVYFEGLAMTIKLHVKLNEIPKTLYLYNAILTDIFTDQKNLLIYSRAEMEKGVKFDARHKEELLKL